jgi:hypothetical protein
VGGNRWCSRRPRRSAGCGFPRADGAFFLRTPPVSDIEASFATSTVITTCLAVYRLRWDSTARRGSVGGNRWCSRRPRRSAGCGFPRADGAFFLRTPPAGDIKASFSTRTVIATCHAVYRLSAVNTRLLLASGRVVITRILLAGGVATLLPSLVRDSLCSVVIRRQQVRAQPAA